MQQRLNPRMAAEVAYDILVLYHLQVETVLCDVINAFFLFHPEVDFWKHIHERHCVGTTLAAFRTIVQNMRVSISEAALVHVC